MPTRRVARISVTPVKGFALLDADGKRLRSSNISWPAVVKGHYNAASETLTLRFPGGEVAEGSAVGAGPVRDWDFHGGQIEPGRIVEGEWNDLLSALAGQDVRIVRPEEPGRVREDPVTLVSSASVGRLEQEAGSSVDARRFRMLFDLDGCSEHEEDTWNGRLVRVGEAVVRVGAGIPRCAVTTRDPDTGERDLDTLRLIKGYRGLSADKTVDFGVYAAVEQPGRVRVGDPVEPM